MVKTIQNLLSGLAISIALLIVIEAGARVVTTLRSDNASRRSQDWLVFSPDVGWKPRPNFDGMALQEQRRFDRSGRVVTSLSPDHNNKPRILLLGDSCTYGFGVDPDSTFAARLDTMLESFAVINLGVPGYTSYQGLRLLEKELALQPILIVVAFNYNDRRYVLDSGKMDGPAYLGAVWRWSKVQWLSRYYTFSMMRKVLRRALGRADSRVDLRSAPVRVPLESYALNLEKMASLARERDIPIVFLVMGDNPNFTRWIRQGRAFRESKQMERAARAFNESIALRLFDDLARVELADTYARMGRNEDAEQIATVTSAVELTGGSVVRPDEGYCDAMVIAGQSAGAYVVDGREVLNEDPSVFFDQVHFGAEGHSKIAVAIRDFLFSTGLTATPTQP